MGKLRCKRWFWFNRVETCVAHIINRNEVIEKLPFNSKERKYHLSLPSFSAIPHIPFIVDIENNWFVWDGWKR